MDDLKTVSVAVLDCALLTHVGSKVSPRMHCLFVYMYHVFVLPFGKSCDFPLYHGFPSSFCSVYNLNSAS